ncbi:MAG: YitT family protein [Anaerolineae bacterium]
MLKTINWRSLSVKFLLLTIAAIIDAIGVIVFMVPADVAPGGVSGIGVILNHLFGTPIGLIILLGNIPIQILAYRMLGGWKVIAGTVYVLIVYSFLIDFLTPFFPAAGVSDNPLLNALFGGILTGIGTGLVYLAGATFGGTSTLGRIIQIRFGTPMSTTSLYTDTLVIALAGLAFNSWEAALYALVALFISGVATDYVLEGPSIIRTALIITDRPREVSDAILHQLGRGVTAWNGTGMFTDQQHTVLFITIARPQVGTLRQLILQVDPAAFIVIGQGQTAYGQGFIRTQAKHIAEAGD